jgi:predicted sulfurtransferase
LCTGKAADIRAFCRALRQWNPIFEETDFKISDGVSLKEGFQALTIGKKDELVAYGLEHERAPALNKSSAVHLEADEYHEMLKRPDAVVIDVRNAYETAIGHIKPPEGGAEFIDPKMRNSHEFPKWLNSDEAKTKLKGKQVMMYCTGGIRCERATALLHEMEQAMPDLDTKGICMVRGGIDRYIKTFPEGGFWKGKNFLFDKRKVQIPAQKDEARLNDEVDSHCASCGVPWDEYLGRFKCKEKKCKVPILVCRKCKADDTVDERTLRCPLCVEGRNLRDLAVPDCVVKKRKLEAVDDESSQPSTKVAKSNVQDAAPSNWLFLRGLPYNADLSAIKAAVTTSTGVKQIHWALDKTTKLFYGSCFLDMGSIPDAQRVLLRQEKMGGFFKVKKRRVQISFAKNTTSLQNIDSVMLERPPLPGHKV